MGRGLRGTQGVAMAWTAASNSEWRCLRGPWWRAEARREEGHDTRQGPLTVADAMGEYLKAYERRGGKAVYETQRAVETHILPALGTVPVGKLTARKIADWHHGLAEKRARVRTKPGRRQNYREAVAGPDAVRKRRATANRILTVLKAALNHAWKAGQVASDDAWRRTKPFKAVETALVRALTFESSMEMSTKKCHPSEPTFSVEHKGCRKRRGSPIGDVDEPEPECWCFYDAEQNFTLRIYRCN